MGIVTALDITNDPTHGIRSRAIAETLVKSKDKRIKYVISDGEIASGTEQGNDAWVWRDYKGKNAHNHHFHVSVKSDKALYDDDTSWNLDGFSVDSDKTDIPMVQPKYPLLVFGNKGPDVQRAQVMLNDHGANLDPDGDFGQKTLAAVKKFQKKANLEADGKVGRYTWEALEKGG